MSRVKSTAVCGAEKILCGNGDRQRCRQGGDRESREVSPCIVCTLVGILVAWV
jgi:hypothetical protein